VECLQGLRITATNLILGMVGVPAEIRTVYLEVEVRIVTICTSYHDH
jgi:hypothetical protein